MSDRLAVFNNGRIEQVGAPAEVYERPATRFVAGFVGTSNLLTGAVAEAVDRTNRHVHHPAGEDPPGRAGDHRGGRRALGDRPDPRRRLPRPGHALHRGARCRGRPGRHAAEPGDVLDRGARPAGQGCPPGLEATAQSRDRGRGLIGSRLHAGRRGGTGMRTRRLLALGAAAAMVASACSSTGGGSPAPSLPTELGSTQGQTINVLSWPGYVEDGQTVAGRRLGDRLRGELRLHRQRTRSSARRMRRTPSTRRTPSSSTSCRPRATRACAWYVAASSSRSTWTCSRATRTSSRPSRTSRTTPSTASPTASRTGAAPTC